MNKVTVTISAVLVGILLISCSSKTPLPKNHDLTKLTLTQNLNISAKNLDVLVGTISGLATDDGGRIYAADTKLQKIHIFSPDGKYLDSLGHKGKGPGEFLRMDPDIRIKVDTLYIYDKRSRHISLFNLTSHRLIRTINVPHEKVKGESMGPLKRMFPLYNGNLIVAFEYAYRFQPKESDPTRKTTISILNGEGNFVEKNSFQTPLHIPPIKSLLLCKGIEYMCLLGYPFYRILKWQWDRENIYIWAKAIAFRFKNTIEMGKLSINYPIIIHRPY